MKTPVPIMILDNTSTFGGSTQSLCYLLRALDKEQFEPVLVTGQSTEFLAEHFDCTWYHFVPKLPWVNNHLYKKISAAPVFRLQWLRKLLNISRFLYWVIFINVPEAIKYFRLGRNHQVALVHLNVFGCQLSGILAAKLLRVPCVAHLRDFEADHPLTRFYTRLIDHHVAISGAVRDNLRQIGVPDERITVVHDALDLADFQPIADYGHLTDEFSLAPGQPTFGLFGRIVEWKGIREFILAVREVLEVIPEARGFVVGDHSDGDEGFYCNMQQLASDLGLQGKLVFTGYRNDVPALMGMMDVVVHASIRPEPFGMVIIEGMAMEKPVIASKAGGALDIVVDGETGLLVEMGDVKALGQAIRTLLGRQEQRRTMGLAGRARVEEQFTSRRYASQMSAIYRDLVGA